MLNVLDVLLERTNETPASLLMLIAIGALRAEELADVVEDTDAACRARYVMRKIDEIEKEFKLYE